MACLLLSSSLLSASRPSARPFLPMMLQSCVAQTCYSLFDQVNAEPHRVMHSQLQPRSLSPHFPEIHMANWHPLASSPVQSSLRVIIFRHYLSTGGIAPVAQSSVNTPTNRIHFTREFSFRFPRTQSNRIYRPLPTWSGERTERTIKKRN